MIMILSVSYRVRRELTGVSPMCPMGAGPRLVSAGSTIEQAWRVRDELASAHPMYRFTLERVTVETVEE